MQLWNYFFYKYYKNTTFVLQELGTFFFCSVPIMKALGGVGRRDFGGVSCTLHVAPAANVAAVEKAHKSLRNMKQLTGNI